MIGSAAGTGFQIGMVVVLSAILLWVVVDFWFERHYRRVRPKVLKALGDAPAGGMFPADVAAATGLGASETFHVIVRLEVSEFVEGEWETSPRPDGKPRRLRYRLTELGREMLEEVAG